VTLAAYPLVPRSDIGFRVQMTAANTDAEIDQLVGVLDELQARFRLQTVKEPREAANDGDRICRVLSEVVP